MNNPTNCNTSQFQNVVFSGGGNRCFWQAGFWSVVAQQATCKPSTVAAVSAGAAVSCALFSGTFSDGFSVFKRALSSNRRNLYLKNVLGERPVFPHGNLYRETILQSINAQALTRLHQGPDIRLLVACPPRWASQPVAVLLGLIALSVDTFQSNSVHPSGGHRVGFRPLYIPVRQCDTPGALADLIIASSCVPPLTTQARLEGRVMFDGGLVSNVPTSGIAQETGETLVLLTRQFKKLPNYPGRTYVQPSRPIPVAAWDYTNAEAVQSAYDLGQFDGERFCRKAQEPA